MVFWLEQDVRSRSPSLLVSKLHQWFMLQVAFFSTCPPARWDVCLSLLGVIVLKQISNSQTTTGLIL